MAVLAFERADLEELGAERRGDGDLERDAFDAREGLDRSADVRCGPEQRPAALRVAESVSARRAAAVSALRRISPASDVGLHRPPVAVADGPLIRSSRCDSPTRKNWNVPRVEPGVHLQLDRTRGRPRPADRAERAAHLERRAGCTARVTRRPRTAASSASPPNLSRPPPCA